jgi:hypothetical protein
MKVFVSYAHKQGAWVWGRLVPVLKAGGAEVLIDHERFHAGLAVVGQMDCLQDQAERQLVCWSANHVASDACRHEWLRSVAKDPQFQSGVILLARLDGSDLPVELPADLTQPLYVDLRDDSKPDPWQLLLRGCAAEFGTTVPTWLAARDEVANALGSFRSVNLVVRGRNVRWRDLIKDVKERTAPDLALVDLQDARAHTREGLLATILAALGMGAVKLPKKPQDLAVFADRILALGGKVRIGLTHCDLIPHRSTYDVDLFAGLRWLVMEGGRPVTLFVQSRTPFGELLPRGHPLSEIDFTAVELR